MAPSQPLYADDSGSDSDTATRPFSRKKVADSDFNNSPNNRPPLRSVNINDDAAEKRRRRKSTKAVVPEPVPSEDAEDHEASRSRHRPQLNTLPVAPIINVTMDVMNSNYEEWMKMATDNKINATNSWNFALIDYFHDMKLLRNNGDNSINFQRASCTLDGCIKIWTSRVDSVGTETAKLASNLASGGHDEDADDDGEDDPDADPSQPKKKKAHRSGATLVKDPSQLHVKKLDLEFSVDPLFRKTCADFDEGGAQGLLMNHLSLGMGGDGGLRVVFDAGDSVSRIDEEDDAPEPPDDVDLGELRRMFLPDLSTLDDKAISHSLAEFSFAKEAFSFGEATFFQDDTHIDADDDDDTVAPDLAAGDVDVDPQNVEDFFANEDVGGGDDYGAEMMGGDDYGGDHTSNGSVGPTGDMDQTGGAFVPFDPANPTDRRDYVYAMNEGDGDNGVMDMFDQNFRKNWAGPEHFKLKRFIRRSDDVEGAAVKAKPRKEKKESSRIDFLTPSNKDKRKWEEELFAPAGKGASINLPAAKKAKQLEKKDDHLLPDDMHFSSRQLVTLFLKPKFSLQMRGKNVRLNQDNGNGEVDENFWAQAAAGQQTGHDEDQADDDGALPFNTQFFHDDDDDGPGFDDVDPFEPGIGDADAGEQDLLAATQGQTRKVRPEFVNYAKRAKRVDVRKLKENIWKGLDIVVAKSEVDQDAMEVDDDASPTDPSDARVFSTVISDLQKSYPKEKMQEISTSFCFICLLHLANEQGLKLRHEDQDLEDNQRADDDEKRVGNIWGLKVYRDPNATQAA